MKKYFISVVIVLSFFCSSMSHADSAVTPLSVGILPPVQFPGDDYTITGLRASLLWGHHRNVYGLDIGVLGNITDQSFTGIGISGLFNKVGGNANIIGLQLAGLANINTNKADIYGLQLALGSNYNSASSTLVGVQISLANLSQFTDVYGAQLGVYNYANEVHGLQIGLVNRAVSLHGIQIGLINFHHKGMIGVSPILNIGF